MTERYWALLVGSIVFAAVAAFSGHLAGRPRLPGWVREWMSVQTAFAPDEEAKEKMARTILEFMALLSGFAAFISLWSVLRVVVP